MKYEPPIGHEPIKPKDEFLMNLKFGTPAIAIEQLLTKVSEHPNVHFRPKGQDSDDYDEFLINFHLQIPSLLYYQPVKTDDTLPSWQQFEEMIFRCTGVYPRYADHEDHDSLYVEFGTPAEFKLGWGFKHWIEGLEELLHVADMEGEIEDYVTNKLMEMKNGKDEQSTADVE